MGSILGLGRSLEEGNGYPYQYSCLENPMDRGAWQATSMGWQRVGRGAAVPIEALVLLPDDPQQRAEHGGSHLVDRKCQTAATLLTLPQTARTRGAGPGPQGAGL